MTELEKRKAAKEFVSYWKDKGYEKGESQPFWLSLLRDLFDVAHPEQYIRFEDQVKLDHTSFIDGYIAATHVLIEQKGVDKDLRKPIKQADGSLLTPFQQAKRYAAELPYSQRPRWIITCNFGEFLIYDMEKPTGEPDSILLSELEKEYYRLQFLVEEKSELLHREEQVSMKAGELVGKLYDAILKQYLHPDNENSLRSLNMLCVRLVFCLYAEDAGIFGDRNKFHNYIGGFAAKDVRRALIDLFRVLDTKIEDRDPYMDEQLAAFPYVNGGLFADENIEIPNFTQEIVDLLLHNASEDFDWSQISPTIFGAVFESTLNPETRRSGGMHYTSIENIHKVIDPLFLDELREEFDEIKAVKVSKLRKDKAEAFRAKLAGLTFFDPACGSGNFLTETYISLRRLENEAILLVTEGQLFLDFGDAIKVSIGQFYGIEINDFAVTVAKTALWIAESQMLKETEDILQVSLDFLPLKSYANIVEGNALRIDWETVVPKDKLNYIMGNPPFVGYKEKKQGQKDDMDAACVDLYTKKTIKNVKTLDYVAGWYYKAANYCYSSPQRVTCAFVSTNSITQGEQVSLMWKPLIEGYGLIIDFVHKTFKWNSESPKKAAVHCVIIGFSFREGNNEKRLYSNGTVKNADSINPYLIESNNVWLESRRKPLNPHTPLITLGVHLYDNHNFIFETLEEKNFFLKQEPQAEKYFKKWVSGSDIINGKNRWYLDLTGLTPHELRQMKLCMERIQNVIEYRTKANCLQEFPLKPKQGWKANSNYLAIPFCSSENRKYIPLCFLDSDIVITMPDLAIPNATLFDFGVLTSNVHMAWVRVVCGRLKSDYRYTSGIVYNNFPWPTPTAEQKKKIEQTAQAILDARALYPDCSLADLYDEIAMPPELRKAHQANDKAVMQAYGFWGKLNSEPECVAELMKMYQKLTQ